HDREHRTVIAPFEFLTGLARAMPTRHYLLALACYLAIPAAVTAGAAVHRLIDPEMARRHADYVRGYWLLELVRAGVLMAAAGLALLLWISTCALVLKSRQRSL